MPRHLPVVLGSVLLLTSARLAPVSPAPAGRETGTHVTRACQPACWQLRSYTINRGKLDEFAAAWRQGVYPLRIKHGFQIPNAWIARETNQFVWLIGYQGPEDWEAKESAYYGSTERTTMDPDPRQWIARAEVLAVTPFVPGP